MRREEREKRREKKRREETEIERRKEKRKEEKEIEKRREEKRERREEKIANFGFREHHELPQQTLCCYSKQTSQPPHLRTRMNLFTTQFRPACEYPSTVSRAPVRPLWCRSYLLPLNVSPSFLISVS